MTERQIVAEDEDAGFGECTRHLSEQRRLTIGAGAVSERERFAGRLVRLVQDAVDALGLDGALGGHLSQFKRRVWAATKLRGARRAPRIIQRLRAPAMTDDLPAIMAS